MSSTLPPPRHVRLFRNGANQAVRIPREFELPGNEALMRREGNTLVIEAVRPPQKGTLDEDFPDVDFGLRPLDDIDP